MSGNGEDRYTPIGRLTPIAWNLYDENGEQIGVGSECAPIEMCSECGAVVANQELHDAFHADGSDYQRGWRDAMSQEHPPDAEQSDGTAEQ